MNVRCTALVYGQPGNTYQGPNQSGFVSCSITICSGHV